jgi:Ricin-type beta-trefoil lectin domain
MKFSSKFKNALLSIVGLTAMMATSSGCTAPAGDESGLGLDESATEDAVTLPGTQTFRSSLGCLDISYGSKKSGARPIVWQCHGGNSQKWKMLKRGTDGYVSLQNVNSGLCLELGGSTNGSIVQQKACNARLKTQQFLYFPNFNNRFEFQGVLIESNPFVQAQCLDIPNSIVGADLQTWNCSGQSNQSFFASGL